MPVNSYTTTFPATENPMSEGGVWRQGLADGLDWSNYRTTTNKAFGTQSGNGVGSGQYNDSVACLTGTFSADQYARATVFNTRGAGDWNTEVELLLRWSISSHSTQGYEVEYSARSDSPYFDIVRWNGALGDFTPLTLSTGGTHLASMPGGAVATGDVLEAFIVGSTISAYKNGTLMATATDTTYTTGNPGIGHYLRNIGATGDPTQYGFTNFTGTSGDRVILPGTGYVVLTDEVTEGTLGTGQAQLVKFIDGTINGTNKLIIDTNGRMRFRYLSGTGTTSSPSALTTTSSTILSTNTARAGVVLWNEGGQVAYVKCGTTASTTDYTGRIPPGGYWEVPNGYTGRIDGMTGTSTTQLRVTEFT